MRIVSVAKTILRATTLALLASSTLRCVGRPTVTVGPPAYRWEIDNNVAGTVRVDITPGYKGQHLLSQNPFVVIVPGHSRQIGLGFYPVPDSVAVDWTEVDHYARHHAEFTIPMEESDRTTFCGFIITDLGTDKTTVRAVRDPVHIP
jgi:hypothetical protein